MFSIDLIDPGIEPGRILEKFLEINCILIHGGIHMKMAGTGVVATKWLSK